MHRLLRLVGTLVIVLTLVACGGDSTTTGSQPANNPAPTSAAPAPVTIKKAEFAENVQEQTPVNPGSDFTPTETVFLALTLSGRPKSGLLSTEFFWHDDAIVSATLDLAETNGGILFSIGQDTFAHFNFTHEKPLPISGAYRADVSLNGTKLGSYPFAVVPPADAVPSKLLNATLAEDNDENYAPVNPTTNFAPDQKVVLAGTADLGLSTWIQAEWYIGGKIQDAGTRSFTMQENKSATPFSFSFLPEGGWPMGTHELVVLINDKEAGRYPFTIK